MVTKRACFSIVLLLLLLVSGCQPKGIELNVDPAPVINPPLVLPASVDAFPTITERHADVPEEYEALAETDSLRLYARRDTTAIIVEDLRSGRLWRSTPSDLVDNKLTNTAWRRQMEMPVQVSYVDPERSQPKNAKIERDTTYTLSPVQDGVRVGYEMTKLKMAFDVVFALQDECLTAAIPEAGVKETGENGLVLVDLLAFFGATHDGDEGYIVYPDGSGALMYYNTPHPEEVQKINSTIYGSDASGGLFGFNQSTFREQVSIPLFGMVSGPAGSGAEDLSGYVGIVTHGDFDASLGVARSGKGLNYNHVWTTFLYRRPGRFSLTGGQPAWLYQPDRITGDRAVRYCFLNGEDASYVTMGQRYRDYLTGERGARRVGTSTAATRSNGVEEVAQVKAAQKPAAQQPVVQQPALGIPRMSLTLFMGIERRTWFLADMVSMTTFEQAAAILDDLDKAGVRNIDVTLSQWSRGATSDLYPNRLPVDQRLGGDDALRALAGETHRRGQRLYLSDNYTGVPPGAKGFTPYLDAARGVDGLPIGSNETGYLMNPQVALRAFAMRDIPEMKALNASGLALENLAFLTIPDKNQQYPLSRENFAASYMLISQLTRETMGSVAMQGANVYTVPYADRLDYVPVDSTHFDLFETAVPLYQIAVHGLTQYTHNPYNLLSDGDRLFLRHVEYGVMPSFLLTEKNSADLFRTGANSIYSSQYTYWRGEVIRQYQAMSELEHTFSQFITGHEQLASNVFATTYEDGTRVIVNYGTQPYQAGAALVPATDFIVIQGE